MPDHGREEPAFAVSPRRGAHSIGEVYQGSAALESSGELEIFENRPVWRPTAAFVGIAATEQGLVAKGKAKEALAERSEGLDDPETQSGLVEAEAKRSRDHTRSSECRANMCQPTWWQVGVGVEQEQDLARAGFDAAVELQTTPGLPLDRQHACRSCDRDGPVTAPTVGDHHLDRLAGRNLEERSEAPRQGHGLVESRDHHGDRLEHARGW